MFFTKASVINIQLERENTSDIENINRFLSQESNTDQKQQQINVQNNKKQWYTGTISIGKGKKNLKVILSTGTSQLMIPSKNCNDKNNCNGFEKYYECLPQDGCNPTNNQGSQNYLDSSFDGNYVNTLVSIGNLESIQQSALLFDKSNNFTTSNQKVNGILGLGVYNVKNEGNSSFVTSLYKKGLIKENMFSLYLGFKNDDSQLTLGGIDPQKLADKAQVYTHQVIQNDQSDLQRWVLQINQLDMRYFTYKFDSSNNKALVDSSYPYIGLEKNLYEKISQYFMQRHANMTKNGLKVNCKDPNLANIYFYLKVNQTDRVLNLPIDFYLSNTTQDCQILISPITNNENFAVILGIPFLRRYVSTYSYSKQQISFTQSIADPKDDTSNDFSISDNFPTWAIVVIVIVAVIILCVVGGLFLYKKYKNKQLGNSLKQSFSSNTSSH
ncbi:eukaryotic aspartyl protease (macronuclear) [Tetrahymena thermophila SB210]|uniref:Eukaryotic aspartyl protease n=1 Tax=Tetrahymena thermophila (strain SB210) TaxID=312017 RepID=W7X3R2_TETTS|nr:eukaryotic aspartyl protease [Tetrahymena thermophila SB210]EWS73950.1 eukaryotic aspartyl protease [Tetrahymena thermophila SB210]|eukprot:XP_012653491.1 eukaryotic aspartyl protease [Tetrahymena thermophila SB210]